MKAGNVVNGKNEINLSELAEMFECAEQGIIEIGKATLGEKTMLDAIHPAVLAIKKAAEENKSLIESLEMSVKAAEEGEKSTIDMVAKRGRSSYLGERSRGHQDVGATSTYIILKSALDTLRRLRRDKE
jgi:dihydroxyacetone kinase-like protein